MKKMMSDLAKRLINDTVAREHLRDFCAGKNQPFVRTAKGECFEITSTGTLLKRLKG